MRTAFYITGETTQVVLTPETEWEKKIGETLLKHNGSLKVMAGSFYECQGGWYRQNRLYGELPDDRSVILRLDKALPQEEA